MTDLLDSDIYPQFARLVNEILRQWPEHERYLRTNINERDGGLLKHSERLSGVIWKLSGEDQEKFSSLIADYRFLCQSIVLPEELYFRRHDRYRLTRFVDAFSTVYNDKEFMTRYMNGLLVSDVIWINHCRCMLHFAQSYLPSLTAKADVLEIGPGHGLLLYLADNAPNIGTMNAWDVSDASLELAAGALRKLGASRAVNFTKRNIFDDAIMAPENADLFDGVVLSEVLEHLEEPLKAIQVLFHISKSGGKVWVNVPANSPAPDHLFLVKNPTEAADLVARAGFEVIEQVAYPMSGTTLDQAIKKQLTVSCIVVGRKPV